MSLNNEEIRVIWDFLTIQQSPEKADVIFLFGTQDEKSPDRAAELYHHGYAPKILVTGGYGPFTQGKYKEPEAVVFGARLEELGVPREDIILEENATNTGENVEFGMRVLAEHGIPVAAAILVSRQYMMRRIMATFLKQYPDIRTISCPSAGSYEEYLSWMDEKTPGRAAARLVAEIQRLIVYPGNGFMEPVEIPRKILKLVHKA